MSTMIPASSAHARSVVIVAAESGGTGSCSRLHASSLSESCAPLFSSCLSTASFSSSWPSSPPGANPSQSIAYPKRRCTQDTSSASAQVSSAKKYAIATDACAAVSG